MAGWYSGNFIQLHDLNKDFPTLACRHACTLPLSSSVTCWVAIRIKVLKN